MRFPLFKKRIKPALKLRGLTALIGIGAVLHMGVTLAILPATGITLPFVSYGRSSLLVALAATGMLISVGEGRTGRDSE